MNILVTGSTGFIGGALCKTLVAQGHNVRAFHRASSTLRLLDDLPVEHAIGDLTQPQTLVDAMRGIQVVFHTAAMLGGLENPSRMYAVTVEGTRGVLQAALQAGVQRFVHTSSVAALGVPEQAPGRLVLPVLLDESHTWNYHPNRWPYGYAKYLAELEVQLAVGQGLDAVIVNPSVVFGAGDIYRQTDSLILQVARSKLPFLVEGGANFVHIADVVAGHLAALERGRKGERYILGGENLSHAKIVELIAAVTDGKQPVLILPAWLVRAAARPARLLQSYLRLPVNANMLNLAGIHFYYDTRKAQIALQLPAARPIRDAIAEAYSWFQSTSSSSS